MSIVWDRHFSNGIRELGYDIMTERLIVVVPGGERRYYAPVSYAQYAAISGAMFPERIYRETIEGKIPRIEVAGYE
ncbi:hypothetical protein Mboo_0871 [Methanoregula boonei 6A8]|jgi:hypothetical protein|uniref:KTSC domain-containing protein n=1 Tax=Methanoregula boonei (strain DSM 21154 / JCM 14090 / 6A8) TaxID=456442 RepID=A7I6M8_METB6|nr:hypothetical protein [Methanoregula boonei]ABS55389.1 hypothetical protein Mboo_0871 [Methanoregula boonei 6A8]